VGDNPLVHVHVASSLSTMVWRDLYRENEMHVNQDIHDYQAWCEHFDAGKAEEWAKVHYTIVRELPDPRSTTLAINAYIAWSEDWDDARREAWEAIEDQEALDEFNGRQGD